MADVGLQSHREAKFSDGTAVRLGESDEDESAQFAETANRTD